MINKFVGLNFCRTQNWSGRPWRSSCRTPLRYGSTDRPTDGHTVLPRIEMRGWSLEVRLSLC